MSSPNKRRDDEQARTLRRRLQEARYGVEQSKEEFLGIAQAIEAVGKAQNPETNGLGGMKDKLRSFIENKHPIGRAVVGPSAGNFSALFPIVLEARNDEAHQGASARAAAAAAVRIGIMLEDAIAEMTCMNHVENFMCETICRTYDWETLSEARRKMLARSFSWLPFKNADGKWRLVGDRALVTYLSYPSTRKERLKETIKKAESEGGLKTIEAPMVCASITREKALLKIGDGAGVGLVKAKDGQEVVGIITAFDLL